MKNFLLLVISLFVLRFTLPLFGTSDMSAWIRSISVNREYGLIKAYSTYNMYYPPLSSTIFGIVGNLFDFRYEQSWLTEYPPFTEARPAHLVVKYTILLFLALSIVLLALGPTSSLLTFLNPALLWSTLILGYIDIFFVPSLILSYFFLRKKMDFWVGVSLAITFMIKLIPVFLLPVFLFTYLTLSVKPFNLKIAWGRLLRFSLGVTLVMGLIFSFYQLRDFADILVLSAGHGKSLSLNSLNIYWLIRQFVIPSNIAPTIVANTGKLIFMVISTLALLKLSLSTDKLYATFETSLTILYSYAMLFTGAHENHLFPAFMLSLILYYQFPSVQTLRWYRGLSTILFFNLFLFYGLGQGVISPIYPGRITIINLSALLTVLFYLSYLKNIWPKKHAV